MSSSYYIREAIFRHTFITNLLYENMGLQKSEHWRHTELFLSLTGIWRSKKKKDINEKIKILNETLLNIFNNFIPNKISKFDYKKPVSMNNEIISLLKKRSKLTKKYYNGLTDHNKNLMVNTENECTRHNKFWIDSEVIRKYPLYHLSLSMTRLFQISPKKAELFNSYSASQCTPVVNKSQLSSLKFKTSKRVEKITFTDDVINLIIKNLNVDKAHGWDNISIRMIKLYGKSITLILSLIFQSALNDGVFPDDWKKVMLSHVIKRTLKF